LKRKTFVAPCDVGKGVFAALRFAPGDVILRFRGGLFDRADPIHDTPAGANLLQIGIGQYLLPRPNGLFVNHSCRPNAGLVGTRTLVAIREIEPEEEIRFDYSTSMDEGFWTMECACGEPGCRRVVTDFRLLPEAVKWCYLSAGLVPGFIRRADTLSPRIRLGASGRNGTVVPSSHPLAPS
jgi:hypothetical protein